MARQHSVTTERALFLAVFGAVLTLTFWLGFRVQRPPNPEMPAVVGQPTPTVTPSLQPSPTLSVSPTPSPLSSPPPSPLPSLSATAAPMSGESTAAPDPLIIPVQGVRPEQLRDTFTEARSEGRTHNANDIMAACGTPVVAAVEGKILRLFTSERGGLTIYQIGNDNRTVYYYAHLSRYADGLAAEQTVAQGKLIGYVGDTGNAGPGNCHLHFAMWTVTDPKKFWNGEDINPYPLLRRAH